MTRLASTAVALAVLAASLTACSSGPDSSSDRARVQANQGDPTTQAMSTTPPAILDAFAAAGATCAPSARGEENCILDGVEYAVATDGWNRQADDRARVCAEGWVNDAYTLLSNGEWTVGTDDNSDLESVQAALAEHGAAGTIRPYCP